MRLLLNHTLSLLLPLLSETVSARYDTEKELKGSGKKDEITLLVSDGTGEWPYNSYSGSERQKISNSRININCFIPSDTLYLMVLQKS